MKVDEFRSVSDESLLQQLKQSNSSALSVIFDRYWEKLLSASDRVTGDEEASKDIVQNIFIDLWERREEAEILNLKAYLMKSVRLQVATYFRNNKLKEKHLEKLKDMVITHYVPSSDQSDLKDVLIKTMDTLPSRCREVFYLSRFEQLNNREIAERLNISVRTVETQISKALKHVRAKLKDVPVEYLLTLFCLEIYRSHLFQ